VEPWKIPPWLGSQITPPRESPHIIRQTVRPRRDRTGERAPVGSKPAGFHLADATLTVFEGFGVISRDVPAAATLRK